MLDVRSKLCLSLLFDLTLFDKQRFVFIHIIKYCSQISFIWWLWFYCPFLPLFAYDTENENHVTNTFNQIFALRTFDLIGGKTFAENCGNKCEKNWILNYIFIAVFFSVIGNAIHFIRKIRKTITSIPWTIKLNSNCFILFYLLRNRRFTKYDTFSTHIQFNKILE